ncbi:MAG TPA: hypothetical protein VFU12_14885 [Glycomyces sp.]|nr:hypothetical protein [Glycomyces sp.]
MDFWIAAWRWIQPWAVAAAVCAMMMYGYYLAGDGESDAIVRGFSGTAVVGVPALAVLWMFDRCIRGIEARRRARRDPSADEDTATRSDLNQR